MNDKSKVAEKIRALLAKTVENGCTEAEALAAASKAKALMDEYQIDLSEFDLVSEGFVKGMAERAKPSRFNIQDAIGAAVAKFCDCKIWTTNANYSGLRAKDKRMVFFGLKSDVEFANWLLVALESFVWIKANEYEQRDRMENGPNAGGYYERRNFMMGCCARISQRLYAEAKAREVDLNTKATSSNGRSLVIVKHDLVTKAFADLNLKLGKGSASKLNAGGSRNAYAEGFKTGDGASFGRPVGTSKATALIGS